MIAVLTAVLAFSAVSCDKDEEEIPSFATGFVTIFTDSDGFPSVLKNDYGRRYMIDLKEDQKAMAPDTLFRMVCSYAFNNDSTVRILQSVMAMAGRAVEVEDLKSGLKQDPVQVNSMYIGGGFLNIMMGIRVMDSQKKHTLGMVHVANPDSLKFTVYHDAGGDSLGTTQYAYVSLPLNGYGLNSGDTVFFNCKGYDKDCKVKLLYK